MMSIRHRISVKIVAVAVACLMLVQDAAFALPVRKGDALSPASRFAPLARMVQDADGAWKIVFDDDPEFQKDALFYYISILVGQYLKLGISEHTIKPDIQDVMRAIKGRVNIYRATSDAQKPDPLLKDAVIDNAFYSEKENAFYLPISKQSTTVFAYKFFLTPAPGETPDMTIPLGDGSHVYVSLVPTDAGQPLTAEQFEALRLGHDLGNIYQVFFFALYFTVDHAPDEETKKLAERFLNICGRWRLYDNAVREHIGDRDDNLASSRKAAAELKDALTAENIRLLKIGYEKALAGASDAKEAEAIESSVDFEQALLAASLILGNDLDIDARRLIDIAIQVSRKNVPRSRFSVDQDGDQGEVRFAGNRAELFRAILNLIKNAREAISGQGAGGTVAVLIESHPTYVRLTVSDTGPGFPAEVVSEFNDHGIMPPSTKGDGRGLGVGIAYDMVVRNGGYMNLFANEGGGARFVVELPAGNAHPYGPEFEKILNRTPRSRERTWLRAIEDNEHHIPFGTLRFLVHFIGIYYSDDPRQDITKLRVRIEQAASRMPEETNEWLLMLVDRASAEIYTDRKGVPLLRDVPTLDETALRPIVEAMLARRLRHLRIASRLLRAIESTIPDEKVICDVAKYYRDSITEFFDDLETYARHFGITSPGAGAADAAEEALRSPSDAERVPPPAGAPATLYREMYWNGVFSDAPKTAKELATPGARNRSLRTIQRELAVLRLVGLVEGNGRAGYWIPDRLRSIDPDILLYHVSILEQPDPGHGTFRVAAVRRKIARIVRASRGDPTMPPELAAARRLGVAPKDLSRLIAHIESVASDVSMYGTTDAAPLLAAACRINPAVRGLFSPAERDGFRSMGPPLLKYAVEAFNQAVFVPYGQVIDLRPARHVRGTPIRMEAHRSVIVPGSWEKRTYLGEDIWTAEIIRKDDDGPLTATLAHYTFRNSAAFSRNALRLYQCATGKLVERRGGIFRDELKSWIVRQKIGQKTFVHYFGPVLSRLEGVRHAKDLVFAGALSGMRRVWIDGCEHAEAVLRPTFAAPLYVAYKTSDRQEAFGFVIQRYAVELAAIIDGMEEALAGQEPDIAYAYFLHILDIVSSSRDPRDLYVTQEIIFHLEREGLVLLDDFFSYFYDGPDHPAYKALAFLKKLFALNFRTDAERTASLTHAPEAIRARAKVSAVIRRLAAIDADKAVLDPAVHDRAVKRFWKRYLAPQPDPGLSIRLLLDEIDDLRSGASIEGLAGQCNASEALQLFFSDAYLRTRTLSITPEEYRRLWKLHGRPSLDHAIAGNVLRAVSAVISDDRITIAGAHDKAEAIRIAREEYARFLGTIDRLDGADPNAIAICDRYADLMHAGGDRFFRMAVDAMRRAKGGTDRAGKIMNYLISPLCFRYPEMRSLARRLLLPQDLSLIDHPVATPAEAFEAIFGTEEKARTFLRYASVLRTIYPFELSDHDLRPPLEYARAEGIVFPIGPGLFMTPVTESFRRHLIFAEDGRGNVAFAFEVMVPGEDSDRRLLYAKKRRMIARKIEKLYPGKEYCVPILAMKELPQGIYELYGWQCPYTSRSRKLCVMAYGYPQDGKRLENMTPAMLGSLARKIGMTREKLERSIVEQVATLTAATHLAGYAGHSESSDGIAYDGHTGNIRLVAGAGGIALSLVSDFSAFSSLADFAEPRKAIERDYIHLASPALNQRGLANIVTMPEAEIRAIFRKTCARMKRALAARALPAAPPAPARGKTPPAPRGRPHEIARQLTDAEIAALEGRIDESLPPRFATNSRTIQLKQPDGARDVVIRKMKVDDGESWRTGATYMVRVGHLFFVDDFIYEALGDDLQRDLGPNAVRIGHLRELGKMTESDTAGDMADIYAWLMIAEMLRHDFTGREAIDLGAGNGILALVAWKLGAEYLQLVDYDPKRLVAAQKLLEINGLENGTDFFRLEGDLKRTEELAARLRPGGREAVILSNIGEWPGVYPVTNEDSMRLLKHVPQATAFIAGGYMENEKTGRIHIPRHRGTIRGYGFEPLPSCTSFTDHEGIHAAWSAVKSASAPEAEIAPGTPAEKPVELLVVDDEPSLRDALAGSLACPAVKRLDTAGSIEEGMAMLRQNPGISFLVLDFRLADYPAENGVEFARRAIEERGFRGRIVLYSAEDTSVINELQRHPGLWQRYQDGEISIQLKHDADSLEAIRGRIEAYARGAATAAAGTAPAASVRTGIDDELALEPLAIDPAAIGVSQAVIDRFRGYHVIIADDKPFIRNALEATVRPFFKNVHKAATVEDAVARVKDLRGKGVADKEIVILSDYEFGTEQTGLRRKDGRDLLNILRLAPQAAVPGEKLGFTGLFTFISGSIISKDEIPGYDRTAKNISTDVKTRYAIDYIEKNTDPAFPVHLLQLIYSRLQSPYEQTEPVTEPLPAKPLSKPADISFLNGGVNDCQTRLNIGLRSLEELLKAATLTLDDKAAAARLAAHLGKMAEFFDFGNVDRELPFNSRAHNYKGRIFYIAGYLLPQMKAEMAALSAADREKIAKFAASLDNISVTMQVSANYLLRLLRLSAAVGNIKMPISFEDFTQNTVEAFRKDYGDGIAIETVWDAAALEKLELPYSLNFIVSYILDNARDQYVQAFGKDFAGKITVAIAVKGDALDISVTDEAGGIPDEVLPHIFLRKFTTKAEGTGFGLFWAKRLMEMFGGEITAHNLVSAAGRKGASFEIRLPLDWRRIVEAKDAVPQELIDKVYSVLSGRKNPQAEELAEPIAREIHEYSEKMSRLTKTREVNTTGRLVGGKLEADLMMPQYIAASAFADKSDFVGYALEMGTTAEDIENLLLSMLALDKVENADDIRFAFLPDRQAVVLHFDRTPGRFDHEFGYSERRIANDPPILLRSKENLLKERDVITPEFREECKARIVLAGFLMHKMGNQNAAFRGELSGDWLQRAMPAGSARQLLDRFNAEYPADMYKLVHNYTDGAWQLFGDEDDILLLERLAGWYGACLDYANAFKAADDVMAAAIKGHDAASLGASDEELHFLLADISDRRDFQKMLAGKAIDGKELLDVSSYKKDMQKHGNLTMSIHPGARLWFKEFFFDNIIMNIRRIVGLGEKVSIEIREEGGRTRCDVTMNGSIDPEMAFTLNRKRPNNAFAGPIIPVLVKAMGGDITVTNKDGNVIFSMTFPLPPEKALTGKVAAILAARGNPDAARLAEPIASEIETYARKLAGITERREVGTRKRLVGKGESAKTEAEMMLPHYAAATAFKSHFNDYSYVLEKGTTTEDIENLLLSMLALDADGDIAGIRFAYLPERQAVVLQSGGRSWEPPILLRSRENLAKERDGITPEQRRAFQRILRVVGYAIHKMGGETLAAGAAAENIGHRMQWPEGKGRALCRQMMAEFPDDIFHIIHNYTYSPKQLTGSEDDPLLIERMAGWQGAIAALADMYVHHEARVMDALKDAPMGDADHEATMGSLQGIHRIADFARDIRDMVNGEEVTGKAFLDIASYPWKPGKLNFDYCRQKIHVTVSPGARVWSKAFLIDNIMFNIWENKPHGEDLFIDVNETGGRTQCVVRFKGVIDPATIFEHEGDFRKPWYRGALIRDLVEASGGTIAAEQRGEEAAITMTFPLPPVPEPLDRALAFAARDVYAAVRDRYAGNVEGLAKADRSVVTLADYLVQMRSVLAIHAAYPEDGIIAEEAIDIDTLKRLLAEPGNEVLARTYAGDIVAYEALWVTRPDGSLEKIVDRIVLDRADDVRRRDGAPWGVVLRDHTSSQAGPNPLRGEFVPRYGGLRVVRMWQSSVVGMMDVLLGNFAAYNAEMHLWDHAAMTAMVRAAGGEVVRTGARTVLSGYTADDIDGGIAKEWFDVTVTRGGSHSFLQNAGPLAGLEREERIHAKECIDMVTLALDRDRAAAGQPDLVRKHTILALGEGCLPETMRGRKLNRAREELFDMIESLCRKNGIIFVHAPEGRLLARIADAQTQAGGAAKVIAAANLTDAAFGSLYAATRQGESDAGKPIDYLAAVRTDGYEYVCIPGILASLLRLERNEGLYPDADLEDTGVFDPQYPGLHILVPKALPFPAGEKEAIIKALLIAQQHA